MGEETRGGVGCIHGWKNECIGMSSISDLSERSLGGHQLLFYIAMQVLALHMSYLRLETKALAVHRPLRRRLVSETFDTTSLRWR